MTPSVLLSKPGSVFHSGSSMAALRISSRIVPRWLAIFCWMAFTPMHHAGNSGGGTVVNESGHPVPTARVYLHPPEVSLADLGGLESLHFETTDALGRWTCAHLQAKTAGLRCITIHPDYTRMVATINPRPGPGKPENLAVEELLATNAIFILRKGVDLHGIVVNTAQQPIEGARILTPDFPAWSLYDGRFVVRQRSGTTVPLVATAAGYAPALLLAPVDPAKEIRFELRPAQPLRVRVIDSANLPVAGARVAVSRWLKQAMPMWRWDTDAEGRWTWDTPPLEGATYEIEKSGFRKLSSIKLLPGESEQTIVLRRTLRIAGKVLEADTGAPIPAFRVIPGRFHIDHYDWERTRAASFTNGHFEFSPVGEGLPHAVQVEADGFYPATSRHYTHDEEGNEEIFHLRRGTPLQVCVRNPDGSPASDVAVALCSTNKGITLGAAKFADHDQSNVRFTDATGCAVFQPTEGPRLFAAATESGFGLLRVFTNESRFELVLQPWATVEGRLRLEGRDRAAELVSIASLDRTVGLHVNHFSAMTAVDGTFSFHHLPAGEFVVSRSTSSGPSHGVIVKLRAGETHHVTLGGSGHRVTGRILPEQERTQLDWTDWKHPAFLQPASQPPETDDHSHRVGNIRYILELSADGVFVTSDVPAGTYALEIHHHHPGKGENAKDICRGALKMQVVIPPDAPQTVDLGIVRFKLRNAAPPQ